MKVFCAVAEHREERGRELRAFVVARDAGDAVRVLANSDAFAEYALPPVELSLYADDHAALLRLAGARSIADRVGGQRVYPIQDLALAGD